MIQDAVFFIVIMSRYKKQYNKDWKKICDIKQNVENRQKLRNRTEKQ